VSGVPVYGRVVNTSPIVCCGECTLLLFLLYVLFCFFFFFQAEDGIRDWSVTGVQTCALPIFNGSLAPGTVAARLGQGPAARPHQIGRASCRERGEISVVAGSLKKKKKKEEDEKSGVVYEQREVRARCRRHREVRVTRERARAR